LLRLSYPHQTSVFLPPHILYGIFLCNWLLKYRDYRSQLPHWYAFNTKQAKNVSDYRASMTRARGARGKGCIGDALPRALGLLWREERGRKMGWGGGAISPGS
jgi:hypothetical protein